MQTGDNIVCTRGLSNKQRRVIYDLHKKQLLMKLAQGVYYPTTEYVDLSFRTRFWLRSLAYGIERRILTGRSAGCLHKLPILFDEGCPVEIRGKGRRVGLRMRNISRDATVTIPSTASPLWRPRTVAWPRGGNTGGRCGGTHWTGQPGGNWGMRCVTQKWTRHSKRPQGRAPHQRVGQVPT